VRTFFELGGFFRSGRPHFLEKKTSDFLKHVSAWTRGDGSIFRDFVRKSYMDGPLCYTETSKFLICVLIINSSLMFRIFKNNVFANVFSWYYCITYKQITCT